MRVAGVVLAAGAGRRFGMPKALVDYRGTLLVDRAARVLTDSGCAPVLVVLGAAEAEVRAAAELRGVDVVSNPDWDSGMGSSFRAGLTALAGESADVAAALFLPVDMPGVTAEAVRRVAAHAAPDALAAASLDQRRSHPVLLGRAHWRGAAATAVGDAGARGYLRDHAVTLVRCDGVSEGFDIDRPADLDRG
ncbi:nucleotidyltransferase family protein [Saccharopolyspora gregorii]|uniref:nucleotidyltransferase family protein n=1 Tax=Saccharopolyspora gregorii TaxID=33914 RepID=UPI0021AD1803|nr:nucleotidyltransferase family protein [Saccharopolyspora gregorii]